MFIGENKYKSFQSIFGNSFADTLSVRSSLGHLVQHFRIIVDSLLPNISHTVMYFVYCDFYDVFYLFLSPPKIEVGWGKGKDLVNNFNVIEALYEENNKL